MKKKEYHRFTKKSCIGQNTIVPLKRIIETNKKDLDYEGINWNMFPFFP